MINRLPTVAADKDLFLKIRQAATVEVKHGHTKESTQVKTITNLLEEFEALATGYQQTEISKIAELFKKYIDLPLITASTTSDTKT